MAARAWQMRGHVPAERHGTFVSAARSRRLYSHIQTGKHPSSQTRCAAEARQRPGTAAGALVCIRGRGSISFCIIRALFITSVTSLIHIFEPDRQFSVNTVRPVKSYLTCSGQVWLVNLHKALADALNGTAPDSPALSSHPSRLRLSRPAVPALAPAQSPQLSSVAAAVKEAKGGGGEQRRLRILIADDDKGQVLYDALVY